MSFLLTNSGFLCSRRFLKQSSLITNLWTLRASAHADQQWCSCRLRRSLARPLPFPIFALQRFDPALHIVLLLSLPIDIFAMENIPMR